jgi:hypothetical protein
MKHESTDPERAADSASAFRVSLHIDRTLLANNMTLEEARKVLARLRPSVPDDQDRARRRSAGDEDRRRS